MSSKSEVTDTSPRLGSVPGYSTVTLLARRSVFDEVGGFDDQLRHADTIEWFLRARTRGISFELLPEPLTYRRLHDHNLSKRESAQAKEELLAVVKSFVDQGATGEPHAAPVVTNAVDWH